MEQRNSDQNSVIFSIAEILSKMSNQVNFLIRNNKLMSQLDVDILMENTRKLYDTICSVRCNMDVDAIPMEIEETKDDVFVTENEVENPFEALLHSNEEDDVVEEENPFDALLHSDEEEDIEEENPFEVPLHSNEEDDVEEGNPFDALLHSDEEENIEEEIDDEDEAPFIMIEEEEEEEEEEEQEEQEQEQEHEQEEKEEPVQEEDDDDKQDSGIRAYKKINNEYFTLGDILEQAEDNSLAARLQKKPVTDLTTAIGINDKFLLLNELFSGSMEKYNKSIRALNNFSTYLGAKTYMSELQIEFQWDCDSEAYKKLDNLVERRFL